MFFYFYNSWLAITWQGSHVSDQYDRVFLEEFTWKWSLVPTGSLLQTSNRIQKNEKMVQNSAVYRAMYEF